MLCFIFGAFRTVRTIAQFGSALDWGSRGRGFKSRWSDQESPSFRRFPRHRNGGLFRIQGRSGAMYYGPHAPADPWRGIPGPYENGPLPVLRCQKGSMGAQDGSWRGRIPRSPSFASPAPRGNSVNPRVVALTSRIPPMRPGGGLGPIMTPLFLHGAQCVRRSNLSARPRRNA